MDTNEPNYHSEFDEFFGNIKKEMSSSSQRIYESSFEIYQWHVRLMRKARNKSDERKHRKIIDDLVSQMGKHIKTDNKINEL